jgi:uncharacterized protein
MKFFYFLSLITVFYSCNSFTEDKNKYLPQNKEELVVFDQSNLFNVSEIKNLSEKLISYENESTNQIVIVTIDSITPFENIKQYGSAIGNYWGVGQKEKDNGLIIVVSVPIQEVSIATGFGTQKKLTDSICQEIITNTMLPQFKTNKFYYGINNAVDSIIKKWN